MESENYPTCYKLGRVKYFKSMIENFYQVREIIHGRKPKNECVGLLEGTSQATKCGGGSITEQAKYIYSIAVNRIDRSHALVTSHQKRNSKEDLLLKRSARKGHERLRAVEGKLGLCNFGNIVQK